VEAAMLARITSACKAQLEPPPQGLKEQTRLETRGPSGRRSRHGSRATESAPGRSACENKKAQAKDPNSELSRVSGPSSFSCIRNHAALKPSLDYAYAFACRSAQCVYIRYWLVSCRSARVLL
jgi:hypothetical protein